MKFIAITFPLISLIVVNKIFSIKFNKIFDAVELNYMSDASNGIKMKNNLMNKLKLFLGMLICMFIYAGLQIMLFRLAECSSEYLFVDRMANLSIYPFLPGLSFGIILYGYVVFKRASKKPRDDFKNFLLQMEGRMTTYQEYKFLKGFSYFFLFFSLVGNIVAYNTYISIDNKYIKYSRALSPTSIKKPVEDLKSVIYYSQRKGPNGKIYRNKHPELIFDDNHTVPTFNFIYGKDLHELDEALLKATRNKIRIIKVEGYSKTPFQY